MRKPIGRSFVLPLACVAMFAAPIALLAKELDPQGATASPDGQTLWYDCKDLLVEGKGWTNTPSLYDRLPAKAEGKVPPDVWKLGQNSAGVCVSFTTDTANFPLQVRWTVTSATLSEPHVPATEMSGVDLYAKDEAGRWQFAGNGRPKAMSNTFTFKPFPSRQYLLYLPLYNGIKSIEIGIPKDRTLSKPDASAFKQCKPIVFYGTSITQGACASRPGMAAAAIVERRLNTEVINLGFSAAGRMEPEMADLLAELDPSIYVLDCLWNMSPDTVSKLVEPFVKKLRAAHPDTPIVLAEDTSVRNISPTDKGRVLRTVYEKLTAEGVKNLYLLPSKDMLGDDSEGTVDLAHHNDLGMMRQAEVFIRTLQPLLEKGK